MNATYEEILSLLKDAGIAADITKLEGGSSLRGSGADSLDMMNILLALEEKYDIKIPDDEAALLDSIDGIVNYLLKL